MRKTFDNRVLFVEHDDLVSDQTAHNRVEVEPGELAILVRDRCGAKNQLTLLLIRPRLGRRQAFGYEALLLPYVRGGHNHLCYLLFCECHAYFS